MNNFVANNGIEANFYKGKNYSNVGSVSSLTLNLDEYTYFYQSTNVDITVSFANAPSSSFAVAFILVLKNHDTADHAVTWPLSVKWHGGSTADPPAIGSTYTYIFVTSDAGTNFFGKLVSVSP